MTAAIWSTPPDKLFGDFPAHTLVSIRSDLGVCHSHDALQVRFMHNHHLLQVTGKPKWLTLQGGT